jgi:hypothetical protein
VNVWSEVFLGIIAAATLAMAIVQIGLIVAAGRLARRVERLADQVEYELKPLFGNIQAIGRDASRAVAVAAAQVERADKLLTDLMARIEQTAAVLQSSIVAPAREGRALFAALRAALLAVRNARSRAGQGRSEDDDALFI